MKGVKKQLNFFNMYPCYSNNINNMNQRNNNSMNKKPIDLKDYGPFPYVVNIEDATLQNRNFRLALWTGENLQVTLMLIKAGDDIGLEVHPNLDQFIRIEQGQGKVKIGDSKNNLYFERDISDDDAIMIPAGMWHNIINTGKKPLKLYSIYAPPEHPRNTVHETKEIAMREEENY